MYITVINSTTFYPTKLEVLIISSEKLPLIYLCGIS